jgi:hypothetical protein
MSYDCFKDSDEENLPRTILFRGILINQKKATGSESCERKYFSFLSSEDKERLFPVGIHDYHEENGSLFHPEFLIACINCDD